MFLPAGIWPVYYLADLPIHDLLYLPFSISIYFLNIVYEHEKHPLYFHLGPPSQREAIQLFMIGNMCEHRLHDSHSLRVHFPAFLGINLFRHPYGPGLFFRLRGNKESFELGLAVQAAVLIDAGTAIDDRGGVPVAAISMEKKIPPF